MSGKRYNKAKNKIDKNKKYTLEEAVELAKETATANFDEAIELHFRLGIDPKQGDQQVRGTIMFPNEIGQDKTVAAFVEPDKEKAAKEAGADIVGGEELVEKLKESKDFNFDIAVATPSMMPKLAKIAKFLGPRGLMPSPKTDTIGPNIEKMVKEQKAGKVTFRNDKTGNLHQMVGHASQDTEVLIENIKAFVQNLRKLRPASAKGKFFRHVVVTSTMGPSIEVDPMSL
jgi:large subunit ribosomal protein L1